MKNKIIFSAFFLTFFSPDSVLFSQTGNKTLRLKPDSLKGKDSDLGGLYKDKNYGDIADFAAVAWTNNSIFLVDRSLIQFDFSNLPKNSIIVTAKLSLFNNQNSTTNNGEHSNLSGSNSCYLQRITSPWEEFKVTSNNQPATTTQNQVTLKASDSTDEDYLNIDVTQLVTDMINDSANSYGFMIRLVTEQSYRCLLFASSDHPDSSKHPELTIEYKLTGTGISEDFTNNLDFALYPNPFSESILISNYSGKNQTLRIEIIDLIGKTVFNEQKNIDINPIIINSNKLNHEGLYFIKIHSNDFEITKPIIKIK